MPSTSLGYRTILRLGTALVPALGILSPRLGRGVAARRDAGERLLDWARSSRDLQRHLVWFHAASYGEGLQAEAVLRHLRRLRSDLQTVFTHFSPSAAGLAARMEADVTDYLPYDIPSSVERLLAALRPDLLVFAKADLWPELATRAATTGTQVAIIAATVRPESGRLRWPARTLLRPGYGAVAVAAAISPEDGHRLTRLGVAPERVVVLGDPRFDSVLERVREAGSSDPLLHLGEGAPTMVAGSTWPQDEAVVLRAFAGLRGHRPKARLILVPHEPTGSHLEAIERRADSLGLPHPLKLSEAAVASPFMVADRVGLLAVLYGAGSMAYVGGGFGGAGLHSVLEPAAWSVPVVFGPRWAGSRDASLLLEAGGGTALPPGNLRRTVAELEEQWRAWIDDEQSRAVQGNRARSVVERGAGSSERSAKMLVELLTRQEARRPSSLLASD